MRAFAHDRASFPLPPGHRFPIAKYPLVRNLVDRSPLVRVTDGPAATWDDVALVHDAEWVRRLRFGLLDRREEAGLGLPWSPELVVRALRAAGSTMAAADASLEDGISTALGGGMHHARRGRGRGFCAVNDVAIAIAHLRRSGFGGRILILDLDVHQGDGTAEIFADDATVTTVSLHGARNYPFERFPSDMDVDLPDGTADRAYLESLERTLDAVLAVRYDLAFYLAGADCWAGDRLGRLSLTEAGLERRDRLALGRLRAHGAAVCLTLAGGYGDPIDTTAAIQARTVELAARLVAGPVATRR